MKNEIVILLGDISPNNIEKFKSIVSDFENFRFELSSPITNEAEIIPLQP